ncbi:hypothetical protein ACQPZ2_22035 [Nocardia pseudovaccinii]|uniref:hypothetical protein n=1 Tax=Nocardia pseudovaccinii TaxID=189540 RepID=UPI003D8F2DD4
MLADSETFGTAPRLATGETVDDEHAVAVCCGTAEDAAAEGACRAGDAKKDAAASGASCCR